MRVKTDAHGDNWQAHGSYSPIHCVRVVREIIVSSREGGPLLYKWSQCEANFSGKKRESVCLIVAVCTYAAICRTDHPSIL